MKCKRVTLMKLCLYLDKKRMRERAELEKLEELHLLIKSFESYCLVRYYIMFYTCSVRFTLFLVIWVCSTTFFLFVLNFFQLRAFINIECFFKFFSSAFLSMRMFAFSLLMRISLFLRLLSVS